MCLIVIAHRISKDWPLVIAANRDEQYARPTRAAHAWKENPEVIGGRDLQAGGSWLAVRRGGRFAAVTNVRGVGGEGGPSRGLLVSSFVLEDESPLQYAKGIRGDAYAGFYLIVGDGDVVVRDNAGEGAGAPLKEGFFAISNAPPGADWPKVAIGRDYLTAAIAKHGSADDLAVDLLKFLGTPRRAPIESEVFVHTRAYGTRSSTVILVDANKEVLFVEQNYAATGARDGDAVRFRLPSPS
jgi:uncharacterized protein with NRDE domain